MNLILHQYNVREKILKEKAVVTEQNLFESDMDQEIQIKIPIGKPNRSRRVKKAFGADKNGLSILPRKVSNVKLSRIRNAEDRGDCTRCFPHGPETTNASVKKKKRSWKSQRKTQWT